MRITIFSSYFLPEPGGVQTYVMLLAQGLEREGQDVTVITNSARGSFDDSELPYRIVRKLSWTQLWRTIGEADVLQLAGPPFLPLLLGLLHRKPIVIEHHGYQAICPNGLLLYEPTRTACPGHFMAGRYHKCLQCVATSGGWLRSIMQLLLTFPRRMMCKMAAINAPITSHVLHRLRLPRSRVIYYGIPDPLPQNQPLVSISSTPVCFAYVGRLVAEKGLPLLVDAAARLRERHYDFRLKFIGDGPERAKLEEMVAERGLLEEVTFTGFLSGNALREATQDVAAVVMPSIWEETAGLAAMEQMMRGGAVVVADIGGLSEVVADAGLKFAPGNVEELSSCLRTIADNREEGHRLGRMARDRALGMFTESRMVAEHVSLYQELLRAPGSF